MAQWKSSAMSPTTLVTRNVGERTSSASYGTTIKCGTNRTKLRGAASIQDDPLHEIDHDHTHEPAREANLQQRELLEALDHVSQHRHCCGAARLSAADRCLVRQLPQHCCLRRLPSAAHGWLNTSLFCHRAPATSPRTRLSPRASRLQRQRAVLCSPSASRPILLCGTTCGRWTRWTSISLASTRRCAISAPSRVDTYTRCTLLVHELLRHYHLPVLHMCQLPTHQPCHQRMCPCTTFNLFATGRCGDVPGLASTSVASTRDNVSRLATK